MSVEQTRADLAATRERLAEFQKRSRALQQQLSGLEHVEADNRDGIVAVMVDAHGALLAVQISDEVQHRLSANELSERIMALYQRANLNVESKILEATAQVYGTGFTPARLRRGETEVETVAAAARDTLRR